MSGPMADETQALVERLAQAEAAFRKAYDCERYWKRQFEKAERERDALADALREARLQLEYLDGRQATGTTPAIIARIDAALAGDAAAGDVASQG